MTFGNKIDTIRMKDGDYMEHIIHNTDCLEGMKTLDGNQIDLIVTDPPYAVNFKNDIYDDSFDTIVNKIPEWYKEWYRLLKDDGYLFVFVGVKTLHIWIEEGIKAGFNYKNILATSSFNNGSPSPKNNFGFQFQPIIIFSKGKGRAFNEVDFIPTSKEWFNDKRNKNPKPYTYSYPNWIKTDWCFANEKRSTKNLHPNEKNVKLLKFIVEIASNEGDFVLDSFCGSASTAVACIQSNRNFIGFELNYDYWKFGEKRIKEEYGKCNR